MDAGSWKGKLLADGGAIRVKLLPENGNKTVYLMRMFKRRLSLKQYIEKKFIPAVLEHEGIEFCVSILFGSNHFIRNLYNAIWDKYAQEEPFELSDFQIFEAYTHEHHVLYVMVPAIPGTEMMYTSGFAFAYDIPDMDSKKIRMYHVQKSSFDEDLYEFEVFGPGGQVGCTRAIPEAEINNAPTEVINRIWSMAFEDVTGFKVEEITDYDDIIEWEGEDLLQQQ